MGPASGVGDGDGSRRPPAERRGMNLRGTIYGVVLNDREQLARLAGDFDEAPYKGAPRAPVVYIKPSQCLSERGAATVAPAESDRLESASAMALLFGTAATR